MSESLDEFGQVDIIAIGPENNVYNGHQRLNVWADEHGADFEVTCRVSSRELTEKEREKLTVFLHRGAAGEWDFDILANEFELGDLLDWGFKSYELGLPGEDIDYDEIWKGMPEFEQENAGSVRDLIVHFATPEDVQTFSETIRQSITDKTKFIWYPKKESIDLKAYRCQDES